MKSKYFIFFLFLFSIVIFSEFGSAVECNADGLIQNCTVSTSILMNATANATYNFNGSSSAGTIPIRINANNIIVDCGGVTFTGNYTTGTSETAIRWSRPQGFSNITYKNCILKNYYTGVSFVNTETSGTIINFTFNNSFQPIDITTGRNILITNSTFQRTDFYGIFLEPNSNLWHNITIRGNNFSIDTRRAIRATGHPTNRAKGLIIDNNIIPYNGSLASPSLWVEYTDNVTITDNVVSNPLSDAILGSIGIQLNALNNLTLIRNNISGYDKGVGFITDRRAYSIANSNWDCGNLTTGVNINNNKIFNNDRGLSMRGVIDSNISTNTFLNNTDGVDAYNDAAYLEECNVNTLFENNNFSQTGSCGIVVSSKTSGLRILSNVFDTLNITERSARNINDIYEYPSAICIQELYKSFAQGNRTGQPNPYNITFVGIYKSDNITISGNTFDSDTQVFLTLQGTTNVTHDLTNFWYRKWTPMTFLEDPYEYYISNSYDTLQWTNVLGTIKGATNYGWGNATDVYVQMFLNFTKSWEIWRNVDTTGLNVNTTRFNLTNGLVFIQNGTLPCGANLITGDCNFAASLNHNVTVLDKYNHTEDIDRLYDPIWMTNKSQQKKSIASNITGTIILPFVLNYTSQPLALYLTNPAKTSYIKYTSANWTYDNTNKLLSVNLTISNSTTSNILENDCVTPFDGLSPTIDTTLCSSSFSLNDTNTNGIIIFNTQNVTLDCNSTTIIGNWTSGSSINSRGFQINANNITIKNCGVNGYRFNVLSNNNFTTIDNLTIGFGDRGVQFTGTNLYNSSVINTRFNNLTTASILINSNILNHNYTNNLFSNTTYGMYENPNFNMTNLILSYNNFTQYKGTTAVNLIRNTYSSQIFNNYGESVSTGEVFDFINTNSTQIYNNTLKYSGAGMKFEGTGWNVSVFNNIIRENDKGISIINTANIHLYNNTYINNSMNYDSYNLDLRIKNSTNIVFSEENFSGYSSAGFVIIKSTYINGTNNKFSMIPMNQRSLYLAGDFQEPPCAGSVVEIYKTYLGDGEESSSSLANITLMTNYNSSNIVLTGNTYDSTVTCILRIEGTTNLTQDITNAWYRKFSFPIDLKDPMEFWISNNFNNISNYINSGVSQGISNTLTSSYRNAAADNSNLKPRGNYNIFKDYIKLYNINTSTNYNSTYFNSNNLLMFYDNYTLCGISNDLNSNDGNISCFVPSKVNVTILDNINLTEGVSREKSPFAIVSKTALSYQTTYILNSSLNSTVNGTDFIANTKCLGLGETATFTSHSGLITSPSNTCIGTNLVKFTLNNWEPSSSSNTLVINYIEAGGGSSSGSGSSNTNIIYKTLDKNPSFLRILYNKNWKINTIENIEVFVYNFSNLTYSINNISVIFDTDKIRIKNIDYQSNSTLIAISIDSDAELGEHLISIRVSDEREILKDIKINVIGESIEYKNNKYVFWGIIFGVLFILFIVFMIVLAKSLDK